MDPVIYAASQHSHLPFEKLPPLADVDHSEYLRDRIFPLLDPMVRKSERHIAFAFLRAYGAQLHDLTGYLIATLIDSSSWVVR